MSNNEKNEQTNQFVCNCCEYSTNKKVNFERHNDSAKHTKCLEKQVKIQVKKQEKEAKEAKEAEKEIEKQTEKQEKEAEKVRDKQRKEELYLLKLQEQEKDRIRKETNRAEAKAEKQEKQLKAEAKQAKLEAKQEKKEEEKQEKQEQKEQKVIQKTKAEIEETIPFDVTMMTYEDLANFPEFKFNWVQEVIQNHFFPNLLIALKKNKKTYNVRIINKQVEKWERYDGEEGEWNSYCPMLEQKFDFSDIQMYLRGIACNCPLLKKYKNQLDRHCDELKNKLTYIGECKRILEGNEEFVLQQRQQNYEARDEQVLAEREHIPNVDEVRKLKKINKKKSEENEVGEDIEIEE